MLPGTYNSDDPSGLRRDILVESRIEAQDMEHKLQMIGVMLDSIADDREGLWTVDERRELRQMQDTARSLADEQEQNIADIREELMRVRDED